MLNRARLRLVSACLLGALALSGCLTPRVKPELSQAVVDARAHRNSVPAPACPPEPLNAVSPVTIGFAFNEAELGEAISLPLAAPARWLSCHPAVPVLLKPDADGHGTPAEQDALARRRAEVLRDYLTAHGVAAERIRILGRAEAAPGGEVFLVRAEGRRW